MISKLGEKYNLPPALLNVLRDSGYGSLYPPQEEALRSGLLEGKNLVLAIPTAAGKTLVAEICMVTRILRENARCIYVVPLRALASEKYEDFKKRYAPLGISVGLATGEYDMPGSKLARHQILIATSEKVDSLLRQKTHWLSESLSVAVLDEIHYIHDAERGPTIEIIAARLRQVNPGLQILALSATIRNGAEIARWLDATLISSEWRPVPLIEGVYAGNTILYSDFTTRSLVAAGGHPVEALVNDTVDEGGQALVFVSSRRSTHAVARSLAPHVRQRLTPRQKALLGDVAKRAAGALSEQTHLCTALAESIRSGVAFHHAGLHHEQRRLVEDAFRGNLIKVICATPTLAAGVNLPARRVVIRDWCRYEMGRGMKAIPVFEYKQFAGRAGRPGYDSQGEAILIAKEERDREILFERYVSADTEPLRSQLGAGGVLSSHLLASIASGYTTSHEEIMDFLSLTFFALQEEVGALSWKVEQIIHFLLNEGLIFARGSGDPDFRLTPSTILSPTAFGTIVSQLYLDPLSGLTIKRGLQALGDRAPSEQCLLHLVCCCPDMGLLSIGKADYEKLINEAFAARNRFLIQCPEDADEAEERRFLQTIHTANLIGAWIEEKEEEFICEKFRIGPGDIRRLVESADWLLYSAERIASLLEIAGAHPALKELRRRVRYGIRRELLELVSLKGIGRVRARNLFRHGYRTPAEIRKASVKELSAVPAIGRQIAQSIKKQVK